MSVSIAAARLTFSRSVPDRSMLVLSTCVSWLVKLCSIDPSSMTRPPKVELTLSSESRLSAKTEGLKLKVVIDSR